VRAHTSVPPTAARVVYLISYLGNFSNAAAMCSTVGAPYLAPMVR
jgi:amino acid permease